MKPIILSLLVLVALVAVPAPANAFNIFRGADCSNAETQDSAVCSSRTSTNPISGDDGILLQITRLVAFIGGVAAVIIIMIGGIKFITSGGDPNKISSAKNTVLYAMIGLAVIVLAASLISFIVSRL